MRDYISFGKKLIYIILFGGLVWFISFSIFPENQVIKISVGEESPTTFLAPKYIEIIDEDQTNINIQLFYLLKWYYVASDHVFMSSKPI